MNPVDISDFDRIAPVRPGRSAQCSGGVDDRNGRVKKLTPDIYGPIIDEAYKHGLMAIAHLLFQAGGMTPAQVMVAATTVAARVLKLDNLGTITDGKSADFLVLRADPL